MSAALGTSVQEISVEGLISIGRNLACRGTLVSALSKPLLQHRAKTLGEKALQRLC